MSRAFVTENREDPDPRSRYILPALDDPFYPEAAARALLRGADQGDSAGAEEATGYLWGDPRLHDIVKRIREEARSSGNHRYESLAGRFLKSGGVSLDDE